MEINDLELTVAVNQRENILTVIFHFNCYFPTKVATDNLETLVSFILDLHLLTAESKIVHVTVNVKVKNAFQRIEVNKFIAQ